MNNLKFILALAAMLFISGLLPAQTSSQKGVTANNKGASVKGSSGSGVAVKKGEATVKSSHGGGSTVNSKGAEAKNKNGAGVSAHKGEVTAKSSSGKGVEANKKGLEVKGSKGGMTIEKKHLQIKGKNTDIHFGH